MKAMGEIEAGECKNCYQCVWVGQSRRDSRPSFAFEPSHVRFFDLA